ncbi:MAG: pyridoxal-5'-phosphate-dependent protein subunit beta, partial [Pseudonocardiaceae bacterium]
HTSPSPARVLATGYAPRCDTIAGAVGSTPVLWIDRPLKPEGRGFWAKLEGHNPGGMKDRARCTWSSAPASPVICHQAG